VDISSAAENMTVEDYIEELFKGQTTAAFLDGYIPMSESLTLLSREKPDVIFSAVYTDAGSDLQKQWVRNAVYYKGVGGRPRHSDVLKWAAEHGMVKTEFEDDDEEVKTDEQQSQMASEYSSRSCRDPKPTQYAPYTPIRTPDAEDDITSRLQDLWSAERQAMIEVVAGVRYEVEFEASAEDGVGFRIGPMDMPAMHTNALVIAVSTLYAKDAVKIGSMICAIDGDIVIGLPILEIRRKLWSVEDNMKGKDGKAVKIVLQAPPIAKSREKEDQNWIWKKGDEHH
jgi:hypothetical protein